jgi:hypothetical protein
METFEPLREAVQEIEKEKLVEKVIVESDIRVANLNQDTKPQTKYRKRLRHSTWGILWNTNQKFVDQEDPACLETAHNLKPLLTSLKARLALSSSLKEKKRKSILGRQNTSRGARLMGKSSWGISNTRFMPMYY